MTWKTVKLSSCARVVSGATPRTNVDEYWDGDILWATPKDLSSLEGKYILDTESKITRKGYDSCSTVLLPPKSVLLSSRAPIGYVAINHEPIATNQGFKSLVPDSRKLSSDYLYHWLRANNALLQSLGRGATFKEVSKPIIEDLELPLPSLPEQRRIAAALDKVDELQQKRRRAIQRLEDLLRNVFLEKFGSPLTNPKSLPRKPLGALGRVVTGNTPPRVEAQLYGDFIEWVKSDNLGFEKHYVTTAAEYLSRAGAQRGRVVRKGSILITCIAGSPGSIGNAAVADRDVAFNQQINAFSPYNIDTSFFWYVQFMVGQTLIQQQSTQAMKGMVSKSSLERVEFLSPSVDEQRKYSAIFESLIGKILEGRQGQSKLDVLLLALQHRAFSGALFPRPLEPV